MFQHWLSKCVLCALALGAVSLYLRVYNAKNYPIGQQDTDNIFAEAAKLHPPNDVAENQKTEEGLLTEKKTIELEADLKPKFEALLPVMKKIISQGESPSDNEAVNNSCEEIVQLMMSATRLLQVSKMNDANDSYKLRCMEIAKDMINEAYVKGESIGLLATKVASKQ